MDAIQLIPFHTAGMANRRVDWQTSDRSAGSAEMQLLPGPPEGLAPVWVLLAVLHSRAGHSSAHKSSNNGLGKQNHLISQLAFSNKSLSSRNTHSGLFAPFARSSNNTNAAIVNTIFVTPHIIACGCVTCSQVCLDVLLMTTSFQIIGSFPALPLSVAKGTTPVGMCVHQLWSCRNAHFYARFSLYTSECERPTQLFCLLVYTKTFMTYMTPLVYFNIPPKVAKSHL